MSNPSSADRLQKLKQLQKKKAEGSKQNREEVFKEHRMKKIGENKLRSLEAKQEKALEELERLESAEKGEDWDRKKAWDYSMEDHEKWSAKLEEKEGNVRNAGFINYSQLAEQSYKKEVSKLDTRKEEYLKEKAKRIKEGKSDAVEDVDYNNKPSTEAIERLVSGLKGSDSRKFKRMTDRKETDTYINEKNKHFNEKLDRHYGKNSE